MRLTSNQHFKPFALNKGILSILTKSKQKNVSMREQNIKVYYFKKNSLVKQSHSNLFHKADKIILPYFTHKRRKEFQTFPTPDLSYIFLYLKSELLNEKNNWSIELAINLLDRHNLHLWTFSNRLINFAEAWHKSKKGKSGKSLLNFANQLEKKSNYDIPEITLKENVDIKEFFDEIKNLRDNYLNCNNEQLISLFFSTDCIDIKYKESYLRSLFYK